METKNIVIICITIIVGFCIIAGAVYFAMTSNNNTSIVNNTTSNNTVNNSTVNTQDNKQSSDSGSDSSSNVESSSSGSDDSGDWEYGTGAGATDDPDIHWKANRKTGYAEYYNEKTGDSWSGYGLA